MGLSKILALKILEVDNNKVIKGNNTNKVNKTVKILAKSKKYP